MTEKRFKIKPSAMRNNKYVIHDSKKKYTFPALDSTCNHMFCKALNGLEEENEQLKQRIKELEQEIGDLRMDNLRLNKCCDSFMKELGLNDDWG